MLNKGCKGNWKSIHKKWQLVLTIQVVMRLVINLRCKFLWLRSCSGMLPTHSKHIIYMILENQERMDEHDDMDGNSQHATKCKFKTQN